MSSIKSTRGENRLGMNGLTIRIVKDEGFWKLYINKELQIIERNLELVTIYLNSFIERKKEEEARISS